MGSNDDKAKQTLENMIKGNPAWSTLDAVQSDRLYIMDKTLFNLKPNARFAEAYEILADILQKTN
jgi:iron complex transport system substrate-binding protein